ncbi:MAG: DnaJ domain-containing protein [Proteobacteria bacterium]|nr:DnaJ domain-containing protein [Pseudomonadota bacterium]
MKSNVRDGRITLPEKQFHQSCRILFGPEVRITPQFLSHLQPSGVKTAYRKLALETHPDRAYHLGVDEAILEERFKKVHCAYKQVFSYIKEPDSYILTIPLRSFHQPDRPATKPPSPQRPYFYKGEIPSRRIFIGQFLYYSNIISMRQMWDAVVWQQIQRPRIGDIARQLGWLSPSDIQNILRHRNRGELFGEFALRTELLSFYQVLVLLGRQKNLQPRIGIYFIERGILLPKKLDAIAAALKEHNRRHWFKK